MGHIDRAAVSHAIDRLDKMITVFSSYSDEVLDEVDRLLEDLHDGTCPDLYSRVIAIKSRVRPQKTDPSILLQYCATAVRLAETINDPEILAGTYHNVAAVHQGVGDIETSAAFVQKALETIQSSPNTFLLAEILTSQGFVYYQQNKFAEALPAFTEALRLHREVNDKHSVINNTINLGLINFHLGNYPEALSYYSEALETATELNSDEKLGLVNNNIGMVYYMMGEFNRALSYYSNALAIHVRMGNSYILSRDYNNIGLCLWSLGRHDEAIENYQISLEHCDASGYEYLRPTILENLGLVYFATNEYTKVKEYFTKALEGHRQTNQPHSLARLKGNLGMLYAQKDFDEFDVSKAEAYLLQAVHELEAIGSKRELYEYLKELARLYQDMEQWKPALEYYVKYIQVEKEVQSEEARRAAERLDAERIENARQKEIEIERTRSKEREQILNNILPESITTRLINGENPIADYFDSVSILFMDIVGFTGIASTAGVSQILFLLNTVFTITDGIMKEYGLEKIKTIGDAYMAVSGAPVYREDHAHYTARAALALRDAIGSLSLRDYSSSPDQLKGLPDGIQVRIGVHCGSVAAGVVGNSKFFYDMWGDTVNTAARLESHGQTGKIHVSKAFAVNPFTQSDAYCFVQRGTMEIKGKGLMETYFLERKRFN